MGSTFLLLALLVGAFALVFVATTLARRRRGGATPPSRLVAGFVPPTSGAVEVGAGHASPLAFVVEGDSGPLVEFTLMTRPPDGGHHLPTPVVATLSSFLQHLPSLVSDGQRIAGDAYRVVLKPELLRGLNDKTLQMMNSREVTGGLRLNVVGSGGKVVGQGTLIPVSKAVQVVSAGFQVATFVTGQAHLAQITARLDDIKETLAGVLAHLQEVQEGELRGKMEYLRSLVAEFEARPLSADEVARSQLETVERETLEIQRAVEAEAQRLLAGVDEVMNRSGWTTRSAKEASDLRKALGEYNGAAWRHHLALSVRLATLHVKAYLPQPPATLEARRADLLGSITSAKNQYAEMVDRVKRQAERISGAFTLEKTLNQHRQGIVQQAEKEGAQLAEAADRLRVDGSACPLVIGQRERAEREGLELDLWRDSDGTWQAAGVRRD